MPRRHTSTTFTSHWKLTDFDHTPYSLTQPEQHHIATTLVAAIHAIEKVTFTLNDSATQVHVHVRIGRRKGNRLQGHQARTKKAISNNLSALSLTGRQKWQYAQIIEA